jgi:apolipoprotein N-acyltransferase
MIDTETNTMGRQFSSNKPLLAAIILVILLALGLYGYNAFRAFQPPQAGTVTITQSALEEDYGLRVQLVAVTAAGGLVDLRLQIMDAEKAEAFLKDSANIPALRVGNDVVLRTSMDTAEQDIQFDDGKSIFVMFPNTENILKPGDPVNIIFGDLQLETIQSK